MTETLTIEKLRELMEYNPETGVFKRRQKLSNRASLDRETGVIAANGRRYVNVDGKPYLAHRLAWFYMTGSWPTQNIAFLDGNYLNVRFTNLKEETPTETILKSNLRSTNTSGIKGVSWDKIKNKWVAFKRQDYKQIFLGYFETKEEAAKAISEANNIQIDPEERKRNAEKIKTKAKQRKLWKYTLQKFGGITDWPSFEAFCKDVGNCSSLNNEIDVIDQSKPIGPNNFSWVPPAEKRFNMKSKEGRNAYGRAHRKENPEVYKDRELKKTFGITLSDYEHMLKKQNGVCDICKQPENAVRQGKILSLAVDHNHTTGEIRGLLCTSCNIGIGTFKDDKSLLSSAIAYLEKHEKVKNEAKC